MENWQKMEKKLIESLGGTHHRSSGRAYYQKADGEDELFFFEVKTSKKKVVIDEKMITKVEGEASKKGKSWLILAKVGDIAYAYFPLDYAPEGYMEKAEAVHTNKSFVVSDNPKVMALKGFQYIIHSPGSTKKYIAIAMDLFQQLYSKLFYGEK